MRWPFLLDLKRFIHSTAITAERVILAIIRPSSASMPVGLARDAIRTRMELIGENASLRQQLIVLQRQVPSPRFREGERVTLVLLASLTRGWRSALMLVQPATILRWHRELFRRFWARKSRTAAPRETIPRETIDLIESLAERNRLCGAERIRGELLKLGVRPAGSRRSLRGLVSANNHACVEVLRVRRAGIVRG